MQFKIGQQMIAIMNMFNIFVQHIIKICKYHPPCRQMCPLHFCSTNYTTNLCAWSWFKLKCFPESVHLSLSFLYGCTWNSKINKKSAKLIAIHNIPLSHTHIIIYCNKLNSGCCLLIDSVNVNTSWRVNIFLWTKTICTLL